MIISFLYFSHIPLTKWLDLLKAEYRRWCLPDTFFTVRAFGLLSLKLLLLEKYLTAMVSYE